MKMTIGTKRKGGQRNERRRCLYGGSDDNYILQICEDSIPLYKSTKTTERNKGN